MIKAIIMDWSGVLSDDLGLVYRIAKKIFREIGHEFMSIDKFREKFDLPYMDFYRSLGVSIEKERLDAMYQRLYARSRNKAAPFPYAKRTLSWLKKRGIKLAVFSSHPQGFLDRDIADHGMGAFFSYALGSVHDKRSMITDLVENLGFSKDETLLVGDMAHDIETGNLAGLPTAAVLSGYHSRQKLLEKEPNFMLNDIRDLKFIVEGCYA
ncbi:MAG: HAD family hydrolase [Candidatus Aenigmarchaeota archaeon]|nr:HAD family hydrolase [Candidatus Aenigmarchaeota archaeon]